MQQHMIKMLHSITLWVATMTLLSGGVRREPQGLG